MRSSLAGETEWLHRVMCDLIALSALSAIWAEREPGRVAGSRAPDFPSDSEIPCGWAWP